jgi:LacI family transcriptional regulator
MAPTERRRVRDTITLADVAELAGVSLATASKAINNKNQVRAETRQKVLDAARELSFKPNPFAQALNSNRTGTIGMLTNNLESRFVLPMVMGAEDAFGSGRTSVILADARGDAIREQHHLSVLLEKRVDGIVVLSPTTNPRASITSQIDVPVVYAFGPSFDPADTSFTPDDEQAGRLAAEHLLSRGRRHIALVNGVPLSAAARSRAIGAEAALAEEGMHLVGGPGLFGQWSESWGRQCTESLVNSGRPLDAIIAGNDLIARGVLDQVREMGKRVPHDIAVVGFDNWDIMSATSRPPLTTIDMNLTQLGRTAAKELSTGISGSLTPGITYLPVELVPRESTASV